MKKYAFFILIITGLLFSRPIQAQINPRPGYIITLLNDTIYGEIDFRTAERNAHICTFRPSSSKETTTYYPGDIYAYRFTDDGKFYVTRTVKIEDTEQKLFLEYIIKGVISLYYYRGNDAYFFFETEDGRIVNVSQTEKMVTTDEGKTGLQSDKRYIGTLTYLFSKSDRVKKKVPKTSLGKSQLAELTKEYHYETCEIGEQCIEFETRRDKRYFRLDFAVYAGVKYNSLQLGSIIEAWNMDKFHSLSPSVGIEAGVSIPRLTRIFSLQASAEVYKLSGEQDALINGGNNYAHIDVNALVVDLKLGLRLWLTQAQVRPYIEGGVDYTSLTNKKALLTIQSYGYNAKPINSTQTDHSNSITSDYLHLYAAAGVRIPMKRNALALQICLQDGKVAEQKLTTIGVSVGFIF